MSKRMNNSSLLIQQKIAHLVIGVSKSTFWRHIRDHLPKCLIGGNVYYQRVDLERWIANSMSGCDRSQNPLKGTSIWESEKHSQVSTNEQGSGTSTNESMEGGYIKQLEKLIEKKRNKP